MPIISSVVSSPISSIASSVVGGGGVPPGKNSKFYAPLLTDLAPVRGVGPASFTRNSQQYCRVDTDLITYLALNEAGFTKARRISEGVWSDIDIGSSPLLNMEGYLSEPAGDNELTQTENFSSAVWLKAGNAAIDDNVTTSPNGDMTASRHNVSSGDWTDRVLQSIAASNNTSTTQTYSKFFKADTLSFASLNIRDGNAGKAKVEFNLVTGVATPDGTLIPDRYGIEAFADGWYRCWVSSDDMTAITTNSDFSTLAEANSGAIFVWGAQVDFAPEPSSYIPKTSQPNPRSATELTYPSANAYMNDFSGFIGANFKSLEGQVGVFQFDVDGSNDLTVFNNLGRIRVRKLIGGTAYEASFPQPLVNTDVRLAWRISSVDGVDMFMNGAKTATRSANTDPLIAQGLVRVGEASAGSWKSNANYKALELWDVALSDQDLIDLTTP